MRVVYLRTNDAIPQLDVTYRQYQEIVHQRRLRRKRENAELNAIIIPEGAKLKWSDALGKMVWE